MENREIKFRAWDGELMSEPFFIGAVKVRWLWTDRELRKSIPTDHLTSDDILMQYTGLKDANGVEIYEGDIVRYFNTIENGIAVIEPIYGTSNLAFRWIQQETSSPSFNTAAHYFGCAAELKVIGNIHENTELLPPPASQ